MLNIIGNTDISFFIWINYNIQELRLYEKQEPG